MTFKEMIEQLQELQDQHPGVDLMELEVVDDCGSTIVDVFYDEREGYMGVSAYTPDDLVLDRETII